MSWNRGQFACVGPVAPVPLVPAAVGGLAAPLAGSVNVGLTAEPDESDVVRPLTCVHAYDNAPPSGFVTGALRVIVSPENTVPLGARATVPSVGAVATTPMLTFDVDDCPTLSVAVS